MAVLRDAQERAHLDELNRRDRYDSNLGNEVVVAHGLRARIDRAWLSSRRAGGNMRASSVADSPRRDPDGRLCRFPRAYLVAGPGTGHSRNTDRDDRRGGGSIAIRHGHQRGQGRRSPVGSKIATPGAFATRQELLKDGRRVAIASVERGEPVLQSPDYRTGPTRLVVDAAGWGQACRDGAGRRRARRCRNSSSPTTAWMSC